MEIIESILRGNPCYKAGKKIEVKGLMLHSVGCPQPSAQVFIKMWNNPKAKRACVHAFIDGNTAEVYQTLPWDHKAWHCGGSANGTHIGVEMCEPACIRYKSGTSFDCSDRETAMKVVRRTYDAAVELFTYLCKKFDLNPLEDGVIISHKEGHDRGWASGHGDPDHLWESMDCDYTMNGFRQAVAAAMRNETALEPGANSEPVLLTEEKTSEEKKYIILDNDIVTLSSNAVYYNGGNIPGWVFTEKWIVRSVKGDRVLLGKNVKGTHDINSPVNVKYLSVETEEKIEEKSVDRSVTGKAVKESAVASEPAREDFFVAVPGKMTISDAGVALIAKYEGCRLEAYKCPAGVWTIGFGHTAGVKPGDKLSSEAEAKVLLKEDLKKYGGYVNDCVKKGLIIFPINQNQFDSLTSFCYNCGLSNLKKLVEGRDAQTIADKLRKYVKGGGRVLPGLVRRREEERELFLK